MSYIHTNIGSNHSTFAGILLHQTSSQESACFSPYLAVFRKNVQYVTHRFPSLATHGATLTPEDIPSCKIHLSCIEPPKDRIDTATEFSPGIYRMVRQLRFSRIFIEDLLGGLAVVLRDLYISLRSGHTHIDFPSPHDLPLAKSIAFLSFPHNSKAAECKAPASPTSLVLWNKGIKYPMHLIEHCFKIWGGNRFQEIKTNREIIFSLREMILLGRRLIKHLWPLQPIPEWLETASSFGDLETRFWLHLHFLDSKLCTTGDSSTLFIIFLSSLLFSSGSNEHLTKKRRGEFELEAFDFEIFWHSK